MGDETRSRNITLRVGTTTRGRCSPPREPRRLPPSPRTPNSGRPYTQRWSLHPSRDKISDRPLRLSSFTREGGAGTPLVSGTETPRVADCPPCLEDRWVSPSDRRRSTVWVLSYQVYRPHRHGTSARVRVPTSFPFPFHPHKSPSFRRPHLPSYTDLRGGV